ncbi:MAG: amino acid ABC transporter ATP-binding protein [Alphaproteobacteria bacterium]|nr:amino acid ABC transporter ATP-binding protein [Alphaproteobacteria bacterium]
MTDQAFAVEMHGVNKWYGTFHVLKDIELQVTRGERIVICGPSGSGKSTLVRCLSRLIEPTAGELVFDGKDLLKAT